MKIIKQFVNDGLSLLYPNLCQACSNNLFKYERTICLSCIYKLPRTNFHKEKNNPVSKIFWGRIKLENASAFLFFSKKGRVQNLMHQFKYRARKDIGFELGKLYGIDLYHEDWCRDIDRIIPVPLHKNKLRKRGYNQSEEIAKGLAQSLEVELDIKSLKRRIESETQTKKNRVQRWENVKNIFTVDHSETLIDQHVLLVDDVITTGATIESCGMELLKVNGLKLSIVSIAYPS